MWKYTPKFAPRSMPVIAETAVFSSASSIALSTSLCKPAFAMIAALPKTRLNLDGFALKLGFKNFQDINFTVCHLVLSPVVFPLRVQLLL